MPNCRLSSLRQRCSIPAGVEVAADRKSIALRPLRSVFNGLDLVGTPLANNMCQPAWMLDDEEKTMLRITAKESQDCLIFQLEGKLAGPWVGELRNCWQSVLARQSGQELRVDLSAVAFISGEGKELLTSMYSKGVRFVASGCWARGIVAEITNASDESTAHRPCDDERAYGAME
jgi:hypothetical protein